MVAEERRQSVGFEESSELLAQRERALNYSKGEMPDVPAMEGRSQAVAMDVSDAIETILPDLIEIFMGGDDIVTFKANSAADEEQAEQESDYVRHVITEENDGFLVLYSMFKDALQSKLGVVKFAWDALDQPEETFEGLQLQEMIAAASDGEIVDLRINGQPFDLDGAKQALATGQLQPQQLLASLPVDGAYDFTIRKEGPTGQAKIYPVPPEDFTVAQDTTIRLADTTYCAMRSRPRAQDLVAKGVDPELVDELPNYGTQTDETIETARDTAGEHQTRLTITGVARLHQVEVVEHFLTLKDDKGQTIWRVLTGGTESVLLEREKVDVVPFAAITPYIVTHRFYGESVADKLMEVQKIRTALTRMLLDSGYFALNQRNQVVISKSNEWTIGDLLRNEPGVPVRVREEGAVTPIQSGGLDFDVLTALEFMSVQGEQRTGIVRNAQGLNPDSLHDTASGAMSLMAAAQKRVRMIARVFAETGVKDLFLGVHGLIRKHAEKVQETKLRGSWVPIDPTRWGERSQMSIEVGLGSAGKIQEIAVLSNLANMQKEIVTLQGGVQGPLVTAPNVYNLLKKLTEKSGEKNPDAFWTNPSEAPPQPPQPDPQAQAAQADNQLEGAKLQQKAQTDQARLAFDQQSAQADGQLRAADLNVRKQDADNKLMLAREQADRDDRFRYAQLVQARELEIAEINARYGQALAVQGMKDQSAAHDRTADLMIQASQAADAARTAAREHA